MQAVELDLQKAPGISYGGQQSLDPQKEIQVPAGMVSTPTNPAAAAQAAGYLVLFVVIVQVVHFQTD